MRPQGGPIRCFRCLSLGLEGGLGLEGERAAVAYGSNVTATNCTFFGNVAENGGAILANFGTNVTFEEVAMKNNTASDSGGTMFCLASEVVLLDSAFDGNRATREGGAIFVLSAVVMNRCDFVTNSVVGGLGFGGGGVAAFGSTVYIISTLFYKNYAGLGEAVVGGALNTPKLALTFLGCTLISNSALSNSTTPEASFVEDHKATMDGAISASNCDVVVKSTDCGGKSEGLGGCIFLWLNSNFSSSSDTLNGNMTLGGGAIYALDSGVDIEPSMLESNHVAYFGGAMWSRHVDLDSEYLGITTGLRTVTVRNSTFLRNTAAWGRGGATVWEGTALEILSSSFVSNSPPREGGGLIVVNVNHLNVSNTMFEGNEAGSSGGGAWNTGSGSFVNPARWVPCCAMGWGENECHCVNHRAWDKPPTV